MRASERARKYSMDFHIYRWDVKEFKFFFALQLFQHLRNNRIKIISVNIHSFIENRIAEITCTFFYISPTDIMFSFTFKWFSLKADWVFFCSTLRFCFTLTFGGVETRQKVAQNEGTDWLLCMYVCSSTYAFDWCHFIYTQKEKYFATNSANTVNICDLWFCNSGVYNIYFPIWLFGERETERVRVRMVCLCRTMNRCIHN